MEELEREVPRWRMRISDCISDNFWLEFLLDAATIVVFGWATIKVLGSLLPSDEADGDRECRRGAQALSTTAADPAFQGFADR
jgi:hypothetical protein